MKYLLSLIIIALFVNNAYTQEYIRPTIQAGSVNDAIILDGDLSENSWLTAPVLSDLKTTVPVEGGTPSGKTEIRFIAQPRNIYIGIICKDSNAAGIVSFSKLRDVDLENEDHIMMII